MASPKSIITTGLLSASLMMGSGCNNFSQPEQDDIETTQGPRHEGLRLLSKPIVLDNDKGGKDTTNVEFVDDDGKVVNLNTLATALKGKTTSLSFMFAICPTVCPVTREALGRLNKINPDVMNIVVSINQESDARMHQLSKKLKKDGVPESKRIILYPRNAATHEWLRGDALVRMQNQTNMFAAGHDMMGHSGETTLYSDGKRIGQFGVLDYTNPGEGEKIADSLANIIDRHTNQFQTK